MRDNFFQSVKISKRHLQKLDEMTMSTEASK